MSEMTATRIVRAGILAAIALLWLAAAAALWQTEVPDGLRLRELDERRYFGAAALAQYERHDRVLRLLGVGAIAAQLIGVGLVAWRPPRVPGPALVQAGLLAAVAILAAFLSRLPFSVGIVWWQRHTGIARVGYAQWLLDRLPGLAERAAVLAAAAAVVVLLARRLGRRWWVVGAPAFVAIASAVILLQPLLAPRVRALERPQLAAQIRQLGERQGLDDVEVEVLDARSRSRQLGAEALGIGPTTRIILWDTTLALPRRIVLYLAAHELAHVSRHHLWKGLAWFVLFAVPLTYLLARLVDLREARAVPRATLVGMLLVLAVTPAANAVSRRYEAEADWVALGTTGNADAAGQLFVAVAAAGKRDPTPPRLYTLVFGTHPAILDRIAMANAFRARFTMGLRCRGALGECDARTQGAPESNEIRARLRTRQRAVQRGPATQRFIVRRALTSDRSGRSPEGS
jgi:STE24 endopeptidase